MLEIEPAPNSHIYEIDFMEKKELYAEFSDDMILPESWSCPVHFHR